MIWRTSVALGTESPAKVSANFFKMLKTAGPLLDGITTLVVPWAMLFAAFYRYDWLCRSVVAAKDYLLSFFYASVSIPGDHELTPHVLRWILDDGSGSPIRTLALTDPLDKTRWTLNGMSSHGKPPVHLRGMVSVTEESASTERSLSYVPDYGCYPFYFHSYRMVLERRRFKAASAKNMVMLDQPPDDKKKREAVLMISCFSLWAGAQPIQDFLNRVEAEAAAAREDKTTIFRPRPDQHGWDNGLPRAARTLDAVTLKAGVKEALVQDVQAYLHVKTKRYYSARGIPWRRGYLFYGPPGTGKTSFTTALAGHFQLSVYMVSLSSQLLNDAKLDSLFDMLPQKCIVLLEDVDSAGIRRENMIGQGKKEKKRSGMPDPFGFIVNEEAEGVTLSGLLNVLDVRSPSKYITGLQYTLTSTQGVRAAEGRIVIMTTNNPQTLDEALIRRGRIDQKIHFGRASTEVATTLFTQVFCKTQDEMLDGEIPQDEAVVAEMAGNFAAQFAEYVFTPAEVQGYLIDHRADPEAAVREAGEYFSEVLAAKARRYDMMAGKDGASVEAEPRIDGVSAALDSATVGESSPRTPESGDSMVVIKDEAVGSQE
ncbi:hypothetical protein B0A55_01797 [Friedmanniomyces simplex]|uniref:AAA+ ATPase domain-containing protein n=1 Tax=Friedmanniomyces simplex TaxID=329884 RepID=A0A4U0XXT5_9PEZI|nr:hypothetical protein B0A55_01797 [Friedmanniomyces simplex]